jgi:hypothetical protein
MSKPGQQAAQRLPGLVVAACRADADDCRLLLRGLTAPALRELAILLALNYAEALHALPSGDDAVTEQLRARALELAGD